MQDLERILKALANEKRLFILKELKKIQSGLSVGKLAEKIDLSVRTTSKHIALLSAVDIIKGKRRGMNVIYRLSLSSPVAARHIIGLL